MSSYTGKTYTVRPDVCRWHYRTSNASSSSGSFINKDTSNIWDNDTSSYAQIIDYDSPSSCWGVMSFRLNTSSLPANARPQRINTYFKISYGSLSSSSYYAGVALSAYNASFSEVTKTKPTNSYTGNESKGLSFDVSSDWESARTAVAANTMHVIFRLRCASNLDTYRRFYELYATIYCLVYTFKITLNAGEGGTVTGGGNYEDLSTATLTATPYDGYEFVQWSDGDTNATKSITVTEDKTYTATFNRVAPLFSSVAINPNPANAGQGFIISAEVS